MTHTSDDIGTTFIEQSRRYLSGEYLPKIEACLAAIGDDAIWWRANDGSNSIGNLILHLAGNARQWIVSGVGGAPDVRVRQAEFDRRDPIAREELLGTLRAALADVDAALARVRPEQLSERRRIQGTDVSIFGSIYHVVEHFSMHTGQIILLTKLLTAGDLAFYDFSAGAPRANWGG